MREHFHEKLEDLKIDLLKMGTLVEEAISKAIRALTKKDIKLANDIITNDEIINNMELEIENRCVLLIATEQPVAGDLRFIISAMKTIRDLERIGDYAAHLAKAAIANADISFGIPQDIPKMTEICIGMLKDTLKAFSELDVEKAEEVKERDELVDSYYLNVFRELLTEMGEDSEHIRQTTSLVLVAKFLERLADHVANICEEVIYVCTGKRKDKFIL